MKDNFYTCDVSDIILKFGHHFSVMSGHPSTFRFSRDTNSSDGSLYNFQWCVLFGSFVLKKSNFSFFFYSC